MYSRYRNGEEITKYYVHGDFILGCTYAQTEGIIQLFLGVQCGGAVNKCEVD